MGARLVPLALLAGIALGVATVAVYQWWWGLLLAAAATLLVELSAPRGWTTRLPLAVGFVAVVVLTSIPRAEGDYLVGASDLGYAVLGLALVVLCIAVATLRRPRVRPAAGPGAGPDSEPDRRQTGEKPTVE